MVAYFPMFFGFLLAAAAVLPAPCTSATLDCTEWIKPAGQPSRVLVYRTHPFETRNENITRAFVFVHGILRDADNHFRTALAAAFLADGLDDTMIVATHWRPMKQTGSVTPRGQTLGARAVPQLLVASSVRSILWMRSFAGWHGKRSFPI